MAKFSYEVYDLAIMSAEEEQKFLRLRGEDGFALVDRLILDSGKHRFVFKTKLGS